MARPTTLMSVALAAAAVSGFLPQLVPVLSPAPSPAPSHLPFTPIAGAPVSNPAPPGAGGATGGGPRTNPAGGSPLGARTEDKLQIETLGQASSIRLDWDGDRARGKVIVRN